MVLERAEKCPMCGTSDWEWEADPYAYVPMPHRCKGCMLKETLADDEDTKGKGVTIRLVPKKLAARLSREAPQRPRTRRRAR